MTGSKVEPELSDGATDAAEHVESVRAESEDCSVVVGMDEPNHLQSSDPTLGRVRAQSKLDCFNRRDDLFYIVPGSRMHRVLHKEGSAVDQL